MRITNRLAQPILTEKSMAFEHEAKYFFKVGLKVSKGAIANEIEKVYGVKVVNVRTMIMPGKKRRIMRTRRFTKTKKWKKAVVQLEAGQKIEFLTK